MKAYEDELYEKWKENVENMLPGLLKHNLLVKPQHQQGAADTHEAEKGDGEQGTVRKFYFL